MPGTVTFSVRLPTTRKEQLEALAKSTGRSANHLANEAIASYVDANAWQVEEIRKAVAKADAGGPFVPHEQVAPWLDSRAKGILRLRHTTRGDECRRVRRSRATSS